MKKFISNLIMICCLNSFCCLPCLAAGFDTPSTFEGHAEVTDTKDKPKDPIFTGDTEKLETRNVINMTVSQVISAGISEEGDEFFAEITNEVIGNKGVLLPLGTIAHGTIRNIAESKRLGRDGWVELSFDYLVTPDGREIPIEGQMTSKMHPVAGVGKTIATDVGHTAVGGLAGGFVALQMLGIEGAILSNGYTVLGGAAIGGAIGLGVALFRKGKDVLISPGDEIRVKLKTDLPLPVISHQAMKQEEFGYDGLDIKITSIKIEKDPFGEPNTITINLVIKNFSKKDFSTFDISLVNDLKSTFYPSVFSNENSLAFAQIKSGSRIAGNLSFAVDNPKRKHWLIFYDRQTRKPLAKISIDNAQREIMLKEKDKNTTKKSNR